MSLVRQLADDGRIVFLVTHDQDEALTVSDKIAVMKDGEVLQVGSRITSYNVCYTKLLRPPVAQDEAKSQRGKRRSRFLAVAALLLLAAATRLVAAPIQDGPYLTADSDGGWTARWVEGDDSAPHVREQHVAATGTVTVPAVGSRITSYNVCYTKLLRSNRQGASLGLCAHCWVNT